MRVHIQRVSNARVLVEDETAGQINQGRLLFYAAKKDDASAQNEKLAQKCLNLRMFNR